MVPGTDDLAGTAALLQLVGAATVLAAVLGARAPPVAAFAPAPVVVTLVLVALVLVALAHLAAAPVSAGRAVVAVVTVSAVAAPVGSGGHLRRRTTS